MFLATTVFQWARAFAAAMLGALGTRPAAALLVTPTVTLFTNNVQPGPASVVGDFDVADFTGYADATPVFSAVVNTSTGTIGIVGVASFVATTGSPFVSNVCYGWILSDGATAYYGGAKFASPVNFATAGDYLELLCQLPVKTLISP